MNIFQKSSVKLMLKYLSDNPMEKLPKIFSIARKIDRDDLFASHMAIIEEVLLDQDNIWYEFTENLFRDLDMKVIQKAVECFFINSNLIGGPIAEANRKKYDCNVPWAILMDPTSACNLSCTGCWAGARIRRGQSKHTDSLYN